MSTYMLVVAIPIRRSVIIRNITIKLSGLISEKMLNSVRKSIVEKKICGIKKDNFVILNIINLGTDKNDFEFYKVF